VQDDPSLDRLLHELHPFWYGECMRARGRGNPSVDMLWAFLVVAAVSWLVVALIGREQGSALVAPATTPSMVWRKARSLAGRSIGWARETWDRRSAVRARQSFGGRFSSGDGEWARLRRMERIRWRDRVVALMQLILFVVLLSALFAGALAAAAIRIGHFHS